MMTKTWLMIPLILLSITLSGQYALNFEQLQQWSFQIRQPLTIEQALQVTSVLGNSDGILLARADINGNVVLFTSSTLSQAAVSEKLNNLGFNKHSRAKKTTTGKLDFVTCYALALDPSATTYSGAFFNPLIFSDSVKQEKTFALAKAMWIELFPESYQPNASSVETPEERAEREAKQNNVDFKSKQN
jgi:hypothetical protein